MVLVHHVIDKARVLMAETVVVLSPDGDDSRKFNEAIGRHHGM